MAKCVICNKEIKGTRETYRTGEVLCEACASKMDLCPHCSRRFEYEYMVGGFCEQCSLESED